jgi:hypothetical protein
MRRFLLTAVLAMWCALPAQAHSTKLESSAACFLVQPTLDDNLVPTDGGVLQPWVIAKGFSQEEDANRVYNMGYCDARKHTIHIINR